MSRHLLDVNVLLALVWPRHESHAATHAWFANSGQQAWATNSLTQLALLRLLTNPAITQGAVSAETALEVLAATTRHPGHEFWPLTADMPAKVKPFASRVKGHRQWTDAVLLAQAIERRGVLVTMDSGVKELATGESSGYVMLLKRR